jgi:glutamine amidotransferase
LVTPEHNLIQQSLKANAPRTPTNGDGFGLGWYGKQPQPGLFRSIRPAWNDTNLQDLAAHIESPLFMAHVRATSLATIQETNCHPFRYKNWLFMHNGQIAKFDLIRRDLILKIDPEYFNNIQGTTDSEIMFHLALTYGLENDVNTAIARMAKDVEETAREKGIEESLWMTLAISNGKDMWAFRYGSNGKGPSLYISPDIDELVKLNPDLKGYFGDFAVCIVSEPIGKHTDLWKEVPEQSKVLVEKNSLLVTSFEIE